MLQIFFIFILDQDNCNFLSDLEHVQGHRIGDVPNCSNFMHIFIIIHLNLAVIITQDNEFFVVAFVVNMLDKCGDTKVGV